MWLSEVPVKQFVYGSLSLYFQYRQHVLCITKAKSKVFEWKQHVIGKTKIKKYQIICEILNRINF